MQQRVLYAPRQPSPPGPDVAGDLPRYRKWAAERAVLRAQVPPSAVPHARGDRLDLLLVLEDPAAPELEQCLRAVHGQTCGDWHLTVVVPEDAGREVVRVLRRSARRLHRCCTVISTVQRGQAAGADLAFERSSAPLVCLLGQGDQLAPDAVALLLYAADGADIAYGDEDALDERGQLIAPVLKPDWSPEFLRSWPYLGRPVAVRRELVSAAGGFRSETAEDWEHEYLSRVGTHASVVAHLSEVLVHRGQPVGPTTPFGTAATGAARPPEPVLRPSGRPAVSVIVPFRDEPQFLRTCIDTVTATSGSVPFEIVLVDNGSVEPETASLVERLEGRPDITVLRDDRPFNWAALNNAAVEVACGELLLFLNNDVAACATGWLDAMYAAAHHPAVAAVGARLCYPGGSVQHAGIVVGLGGAAGHLLAGLPAGDPGYLGMVERRREVSAVTGACLLTRRSVFDQLAGFDESLGVDLNDVDFCLRARREGFRILYEPAATLIHLESPSRGTSGSRSDINRFIERWQQLLADGDPYLHPHLTRVHSSCSLAEPDEDEWWQAWRSTLRMS